MFDPSILSCYGLIPVVVIEDEDRAIPLSKAMERASLPVMEITLRTPEGMGAIKRIAKDDPAFLVGAGTVLTLDNAKEAIDSGAKFIVSPGFNEEIVSYCINLGTPVIPGCVTPQEIDRALKFGLTTLKFFPASVYGGVKGCAALNAPYKSSGVKFIPTGGVNLTNLSDYANKNFIFAIGGGWLTPEKMIQSEDWSGIEKIVKDSIYTLLGFEFGHVGLNMESEEKSRELSSFFASSFGWNTKEEEKALFTGMIETSKGGGKHGECGHIGILTNSVERAMFYLEMKGIEFNKESIKYNEDGTIKRVYLKNEYGGFAFHVSRK